MKFLCLCYYDVERFAARTPAELEALGAECRPHDAALRASGHLLALGSVALPEANATHRPDGGVGAWSEGPFLQTKEPLGAFFLIEAKDMAEAKRIAALHPSAALGDRFGGGIELCPIEFLDQA